MSAAINFSALINPIVDKLLILVSSADFLMELQKALDETNFYLQDS